jgi:hypothetical protein
MQTALSGCRYAISFIGTLDHVTSMLIYKLCIAVTDAGATAMWNTSFSVFFAYLGHRDLACVIHPFRKYGKSCIACATGCASTELELICCIKCLPMSYSKHSSTMVWCVTQICAHNQFFNLVVCWRVQNMWHFEPVLYAEVTLITGSLFLREG